MKRTRYECVCMLGAQEGAHVGSVLMVGICRATTEFYFYLVSINIK
jgi:hypothetical protein